MSVSSITKVCKRCGQNERDKETGRCLPCRRAYLLNRKLRKFKPTTWRNLACDGRVKHERLKDQKIIDQGEDYSLESIKI